MTEGGLLIAQLSCHIKDRLHSFEALGQDIFRKLAAWSENCFHHSNLNCSINLRPSIVQLLTPKPLSKPAVVSIQILQAGNKDFGR